jgi:hypothetical protein
MEPGTPTTTRRFGAAIRSVAVNRKKSPRLNQRQWTFLQAIFDQEQQNEAALRGRSASMPAGWRWIPYNAADAPLARRLRQGGVCDPGAGSTFAALERRGLVRRTYQWSPLGEPILFVRLTSTGRTLVREARGIRTPARWPVGVLREWHWRALCRAYLRGEQGMRSNEDLHDGYGYVSWNTCLRLLNYRVSGRYRPLLREGSLRTGEPALFITEEGKSFYQEHWQDYRQRYPQVPAPDPAQEGGTR